MKPGATGLWGPWNLVDVKSVYHERCSYEQTTQHNKGFSTILDFQQLKAPDKPVNFRQTCKHLQRGVSHAEFV